MTPRRRQLQSAISKPPATFPKVIKPHAYNPSGLDPSGLGNCLHCGQGAKNKLHIRPHHFQLNSDSKLQKCMCGLAAEHSIHIKGQA